MSAQLNIGQLQGISPVNEITISSNTKLIIEGLLRVSNIQNSSGIQIFSSTSTTNTFHRPVSTNNITAATVSPDRLIAPIWTTPTRPSSPSVGTIGYNSTLRILEGWNGSNWITVRRFL